MAALAERFLVTNFDMAIALKSGDVMAAPRTPHGHPIRWKNLRHRSTQNRQAITQPVRCRRLISEPGPRLADKTPATDGLSDSLAILGRSVAEIFPANRVTMRCSRCGHYIPRFEGYRHVKVGDKKTFCQSCHEAMGLPLREAAGGVAPKAPVWVISPRTVDSGT